MSFVMEASPVNPMDALHCELKEECRLLAQRTRDTHFPQWSAQELEEWGNSYYLIAEDYVDKVQRYPEDPAIVLHVLRYLRRQDIPTHHVLWLSENLRTLVGLACPPRGSQDGHEPLFDDLCRGMTRANTLGFDSTQKTSYTSPNLLNAEKSASHSLH